MINWFGVTELDSGKFEYHFSIHYSSQVPVEMPYCLALTEITHEEARVMYNEAVECGFGICGCDVAGAENVRVMLFGEA